MADGAIVCQACGWREPAPRIEDDPTMRMLIPVGHSVLAIISSYLGLFSVLFLPAPIALITGILALKDIKKHPHKSGKGRAIFGVVMGAVFSMLLLLLLVSGLVAS